MFYYTRISFIDVSLLLWVKPGSLFVKRYNHNKIDLLIDETNILEASPH